MTAGNVLTGRRTLLRDISRLGLSITAIGELGSCASVRAPGTATRAADDDAQRELNAASEFAIWRRLDFPGHDAALLGRTRDGWLLDGTAVFMHREGPACIHYSVAVDSLWVSRRGTVRGFIAGETFSHVINRASDGWYLDGTLVKGLEHLRDIDYGFTPATNMLQLRRVALAPGQTISLPVVWFDGEATTLVELPQRYECLSETTYQYSAPTVGYQGHLELASRNGFVKSYPRLWAIEVSANPS
jgi:hypothetical protein